MSEDISDARQRRAAKAQEELARLEEEIRLFRATGEEKKARKLERNLERVQANFQRWRLE